MRTGISLLLVAKSATASFCDSVDLTYYQQISGDQVLQIKKCLQDGRYQAEPSTYTSCMSAAKLTAANLKDNCKTCLASTLFDIMDCEAHCAQDGNSYMCDACKSAPKFAKGADYCWTAVSSTSDCSADDELKMMSIPQPTVKSAQDCLKGSSGAISGEGFKKCFGDSVTGMSASCEKCGVDLLNQIRSCQTTCASATPETPTQECAQCQLQVVAKHAKGPCNVHEITSANSAGTLTTSVTAVILAVFVML